MIQVAIIGYGTVGSGVAEVIERNAEGIARKAGQPIAVKYICDIRDFPGDPNEGKLCKDFGVVLKDLIRPDAEIRRIICKRIVDLTVCDPICRVHLPENCSSCSKRGGSASRPACR